MEFSYDDSWDYFENLFNKNFTITESWLNFLSYHEKFNKKHYWSKLKLINVADEQMDIMKWFEEITSKNPLPQNIKALWIGIAKLWDEENNLIDNVIYLQAADKYDKNNIDWAVDPIYDPENKYGISNILKQIDDIISTDESDYSFLDWILPLAYCSFTLDEIIRTKLEKGKLTKWNNKLHVVTGHDSGDYKELSLLE